MEKIYFSFLILVEIVLLSSWLIRVIKSNIFILGYLERQLTLMLLVIEVIVSVKVDYT